MLSILLKTLNIELKRLTLFFAIISLRMDDIFAFPSSCSMCFAISIAWTSFSLSASATALIRSVSFNIFWVLCFCWATSCCVHSTYIKNVNSYMSSNIPSILKWFYFKDEYECPLFVDSNLDLAIISRNCRWNIRFRKKDIPYYYPATWSQSFEIAM